MPVGQMSRIRELCFGQETFEFQGGKLLVNPRCVLDQLHRDTEM